MYKNLKPPERIQEESVPTMDTAWLRYKLTQPELYTDLHIFDQALYPW